MNEKVYKDLYPLVLKALKKEFATVNAIDLEGFASEGAMEGCKRCDGRPVLGLAITVARRRCLSWLRRIKPVGIDQYVDRLGYEIEDGICDSLEAQRQMEKASDRKKLVVQLLADGWTQTEIARLMNVSQSTVSRMLK